jgi:predicted RNase H-like nuclease (RuvC/YqgF family)
MYRAYNAKPVLPDGEFSVNHLQLLAHAESQDETDALRKKNESLAAQLACATSDVIKLKDEIHKAVQERISAVAERNSLQRKLTDAEDENKFLTHKIARTEQLRDFAVNGDPEALRKFHDARREADSFRVAAECAQRTAEAYRLEAEALRHQNKRLIDEMEAMKGLSELGKRSRNAP